MARPTQITDDTIVTALAAGGEVTAAELADRLGMGQSTAAKRLAALEASGAVRRTPGGRVDGVRVADRWSSAAPTAGTAEPDVPEAGADVPGTDVPDTGGTAPVETAQGEPAAVPGGSGRLGRGAFGTLVRDYLAARPGEAFGPAAVGEALGRSQGAVSNLCGSSLSSPTAEEVAEGVGISVSVARRVLGELERDGLVARSAGGSEGGRRAPDRWTLAAHGPSDGKVRLGRGRLREMVLDHLGAHPGEVSPAQLSKTLGHSAGAISNVLAKLTGSGELVQTSDHPRRYAAQPR
jgi:predicted ArsR family transcriptional regulator